LERGDRVLEVVDRAGRRREVQHAVERAGHVRVRRDVVADELERRLADEVRDVVRVPGDEVVETHHLVSVGQKAVAQVRAEEPRSARDEDSHARTRPIERYVKPNAAILSGWYRLRPSITIGRASDDLMRSKSGCRN